MLRYPVLLEPDTNSTILVSFPDFLEAHTFGDDEHEAMARPADLLQDVLADYIESRRDVPKPSRAMRRSGSLMLPVLGPSSPLPHATEGDPR
jgi:antitoxin HicB